MGVTTEPPWVNQASGVAARNGTTNHTIAFGFTSTSGNLLVVEVFGAVTHAAAGWTEQLSPVSSGELSVFTKTSAGENSITVTHNGSNYPVGWVVREYYTGSTYVGGDSTNSSSETIPTISGLPGVEVVVHAARGRTAPSGTETSFSTSWGGSFIEDVDQFTAYASSTDGFGFTSAHQINVTATSSSPAATTTYGGTWTTGDREKVVYAINAVAPSAGTTPFAKDYVVLANVLGSFTKDYVVSARVLAGFTKDYVVLARTLAAFTKDYTVLARVLSGFTKDYVVSARVVGSFTKDYVVLSRVLAGWTKDYDVLARVLASFSRDYVILADVLTGTQFTKDYVISSRVLGAFQRDYVLSARVLGAWSTDYTILSRVLGSFSRDYVILADVLTGTAWSKTYVVLADVRGEWAKDYAILARVRGGFSRDYVILARVLADTPSGLVVAVWSAGVERPATVTMVSGGVEIPVTLAIV